jgi:hypothetical protein
VTKPLTRLEVLIALQRAYDRTPRWRIILRWQSRRSRERLLRMLVEHPPGERPLGEAPLLRGL